MRIKKNTKRFNDNFHTMMENMGAVRRDVTSRFNGYFFREMRLEYDELNSIYQSVPIVRRAIELITGHILKKWRVVLYSRQSGSHRRSDCTCRAR